VPAPRACEDCLSALDHGQRYCLVCGQRSGPPSALLTAMIAPHLHTDRPHRPGARPQRRPRTVVGPPSGLPSPRTCAALVLSLLGFGVLVGGAAGSRRGIDLAAQTQPLRVVLPATRGAVAPRPSTPPVLPASTPAPSGAAAASQGAQAGAGSSASAGAAQSSGGAASQAAPAPAGSGQLNAPLTTGAGPTNTVTTGTGTGTGGRGARGSGTLPPIKHVFVIVLANQTYGQAFGSTSPAPYLSHTLAKQGELLPRYYAVAHDELANAVALISGQGPTAQSAGNCPTFSDITQLNVGAGGQVFGQGCVYPRTTGTVGDELVGQRRTWRAYAEDMGNVAPGQPATCRHPALGAGDPSGTARAGDAYATMRNPFAYFHSLIDAPSCVGDQVGLDRLAGDLTTKKRTPSLSYIVPNLCHDGRINPCPVAAGQSAPTAGLPAADGFLAKVVPEIRASPAFRDGGLLVITSDQAPAAGPLADSASCCAQPVLVAQPPPATPAASGRAASRPAGRSGAQTVTSGDGGGSSTGTTGASGGSGGASTVTTGSGSSTSPGAALAPGGGQVGALLMSPYVRAGTVDQDPYNHFSLLRTIEDVFGLRHLGYAAGPQVRSFDATVFSAKRVSKRARRRVSRHRA